MDIVTLVSPTYDGRFPFMFVFSNVNVQHCLAQTPVGRGDGPLALVLAPTRELAQQIEKEVGISCCVHERTYECLVIVLEIAGLLHC